ncbi:MAG: hypothetical protein QT08_C0014G0023 [archaeon GW2011_AR17]|nr:MAG: hypothetical protein QT08_C0014G0023 [archaeon GW2011_AR17]MBS3154781.1 hypothetical protein [Candidatus Woesearchaeota archaeon]HIH14918.1 hypothetical protein [Nanoarchaeota archaeon]HIH58466.1 hypothetical protein [Nanoarchaeota archaeon]HII13538.1 hypothetical protein [Nanoarchaeota archaeon]
METETFETEFIEEEKPLWKKIFILCLGLFLLFLLLGYFLLPLDTFASLIDSETLENGLVEQDVSVQFENGSYEVLLDKYNNYLSEEFKVCLFGKYDGIYHVQSVYDVVMYEQAFDHVVSEACPEETLIALHSHPYRKCLASAQDLKTLEKAQEVNPNTLIGVMCEPERFSFYR